jgi:hypothetical protein
MSAALSLPDEGVRPEPERRAEAVALLSVALLCHERARLDFVRADEDLVTVMDRLDAVRTRAVDALSHYERTGELVAEATMLLARLRGDAGVW